MLWTQRAKYVSLHTNTPLMMFILEIPSQSPQHTNQLFELIRDLASAGLPVGTAHVCSVNCIEGHFLTTISPLTDLANKITAFKASHFKDVS